jgi:hypothetical protein
VTTGPDLACPHCAALLFRASLDGSRVKARTSILVLHKSGEVEINCQSCRKGVIVPLVPAPGPVMLKKAADAPPPRLVARRT